MQQEITQEQLLENSMTRTRRSKAEAHADILQALAKTPMRMTHIMQRTNLNYVRLIEYLETLCAQQMVERKKLRQHSTAYAIKAHGLETLQRLKELAQTFPAMEDDSRIARIAE